MPVVLLYTCGVSVGKSPFLTVPFVPLFPFLSAPQRLILLVFLLALNMTSYVGVDITEDAAGAFGRAFSGRFSGNRGIFSRTLDALALQQEG
jgi:hypothetical protein